MKNDRALSDHWLDLLSGQSNHGLWLKLAGQTAFLRREYPQALDFFTKLSKEGDLDLRDQGRALLTSLCAEAGRLDHALENCVRHVAEARSWGRPAVLARRLTHLAYLKLLARDGVGAHTAAGEAESLESGPRLVKELATVYRLAGDRASLVRLQSQAAGWPDLPVFAGARTWIEAELATTLRGPAASAALYETALSVASPYIWPMVAIGTGLNLNRLPANVPLAPALWYMAQLHFPGLLRAGGALAEYRESLDRFGGEITQIN
jgi:hypothetical protein